MFTPLRLRDRVLENRVVVSPMCQYKAVDGTPNDWHLVHLGSRATGGAGLVMAEMTDVSPEGRITHGCTGMYTEEHMLAWRRIVDYVHHHTTAAIGLQLGHAGRKAATCLPWAGGDNEPLTEGAWPIIAASPLPYLPHSQVPREMDRADMDRVRDAFIQATVWADEAGFDLIELHMAHGYLLAGFLSPVTNHRTDDYGGNLANRLRYPLEVFTAMRAAWPAHKPIVRAPQRHRLDARRHLAGRHPGHRRSPQRSRPRSHRCVHRTDRPRRPAPVWAAVSDAFC
jgi:anthraniloyl-CoA monooxygenase